jgi:hypothetical protein
MSPRKTILVLGMTLLVLAGTLPALAATPTQTTSDSEETAFQAFFDRADTAAATSTSLSEFLLKLDAICNEKIFANHPALQSLINRIKTFRLNNPTFYILGIPLGGAAATNRIGRNLLDRPTSHFVLSFGAYKRLCPLKQNQLTLIKERLSTWRYGSQANLLRGHTLIIDRHPFGIGQRIIGPQFGLMSGFRGIYWDHESRLTGITYHFFMGSATRIHAFDLTPFS